MTDQRVAADGPPLPQGPATTRIDKWLWAVRMVKTRADAAQACRGGHVRLNDKPTKPAATVSPGDEVRVRLHGSTRIVEVAHIIEKRVGAPIAQRCYVDKTPEPTTTAPPQAYAAPPRRDRGAGRPTKRDRRQLERLRREGLG